MQTTEKYKLNIIEPEADELSPEPINQNTQKLEAELAARPLFASGRFTGDSAESREIKVGFTPKVVLVFNRYGDIRNGSVYYGGMATAERSNLPERASGTVLEVIEGGFRVFYNSSQNIATNGPGDRLYFALG